MMSEAEEKAILERVKRVEKEELAKIAARLKEWEEGRRTNTTEKAERQSLKPTLTSKTAKKRKSKAEPEQSTTIYMAKSSKKSKPTTSTKSAAPISKSNTTSQVNPKWKAAAVSLEGDSTRKSKFMRLMGAGSNVEVEAPEAKDAGGLKKEIRKREEELGRVFETGVRMKNEVGAKRKGLGA